MKKFLINKLVKEGKVKLVEPSVNISNSYLKKSKDCLKSSRILIQNNLFENSISMSYYSMYNSLLSLLFHLGVKSENHSFSISLLDSLFGRRDLFEKISFVKKERIDKQYYVADNNNLSDVLVKEIFSIAEDFNLEILLIINSTKNIKDLRNKFLEVLK